MLSLCMHKEWAPRKKQSTKTGFTIVELLIVVVVIAILAAITIVSYNGIQNRAKASAVQSAASQAAKKIALWKVDNADQSPDLATFTNLVGSGNIGQYQYTPGANGAFCVTATVNGISYNASNANPSPLEGGCDGHSANGVSAITNLVTNPSVENDTVGWSLTVNGTVGSRSTAAALVGTYGITATAPANGSDSGMQIPVSGSLTAGTVYTASFTLRAITAGNYSLSTQGTSGGSGRETKAMAANTTARFTYTWTTSVTGSVSFYAIRQGGVAAVHTFYVDGAMLTSGSSVPNYADGDTAGWIWDGARYNSTSTGKPV